MPFFFFLLKSIDLSINRSIGRSNHSFDCRRTCCMLGFIHAKELVNIHAKVKREQSKPGSWCCAKHRYLFIDYYLVGCLIDRIG